MTQSEIVAKLATVHNTMNGIEVKGKENMSRLLGCMSLLETLINAVEKLNVQEDPGGDEQPAE